MPSFIIFESWIDWDREELLGVLEGAGYRIAPLRRMPHTPPTILQPDVFRTCNNTNFLALPAEELEGGRSLLAGLRMARTRSRPRPLSVI